MIWHGCRASRPRQSQPREIGEHAGFGATAGTPGRRALATASDFADAAEFVTDLYDRFGFDTVNVGPLAESWRVERDQPAYVVPQDRDELVANLARAERRLAA